MEWLYKLKYLLWVPFCMIFPDQTLVVDWNLDSASHWVNQYPVDKCQVNQLRYPMDRDLHGG